MPNSDGTLLCVSKTWALLVGSRSIVVDGLYF